MARIYKEQVDDSVQLTNPDTSLMQHAGKMGDAYGEQLKARAVMIDQANAQKVQNALGFTKKQLQQNWNNAYAMYKEDPMMVEQVARKANAQIIKSLPATPETEMMLAEIEVWSSGKLTQAARKSREIANEQGRQMMKDMANERARMLENNGAVIAIIPDEMGGNDYFNPDMQIALNRSIEAQYESIDAVDGFGRHFHTDSERATMRKELDNRGYSALRSWAGEEMGRNPEKIGEMIDWLKANPKDAKAMYGADQDYYENTISDLESIYTKQASSDVLYQRQKDRINVENMMGNMYDKDKGLNKEFRNVATLAEQKRVLEQTQNSFVTASDVNKYNDALYKINQSLTEEITGGKTESVRGIFGNREPRSVKQAIHQSADYIFFPEESRGVDRAVSLGSPIALNQYATYLQRMVEKSNDLGVDINSKSKADIAVLSSISNEVAHDVSKELFPREFQEIASRNESMGAKQVQQVMRIGYKNTQGEMVMSSVRRNAIDKVERSGLIIGTRHKDKIYEEQVEAGMATGLTRGQAERQADAVGGRYENKLTKEAGL